MSVEDQDPIVTEIIKEIFQDQFLSTPVYRADLITDDDVREKISSLPLIYIWNEDQKSGTFTITINVIKIEELLERHVGRTDARFVQYRDQVSTFVTSIVNQTVVETCQRTRQFPSSLFAGEEGDTGGIG
jgi:hypothetical protein